MRTVRVTAKTVEAAVEDGIKQLGISREEAIVHVVEQPSGGLFGLIHKKPAVVDVSAVDEPEAEETPEAPKAEETPAEAPKAEETKEEPAKEGIKEAAEAPAEAAEESKEPEETESKENEEKPAHKEGREEAPFNAEEQEQTAEEAKKFLENVFKGMHLNVTMEKMMNEDRILLSLHGEGLGILIGKHGQTLDALQYLTNLAAGKSFRHHYFVMLDVENYRERRQDTLEALAHRLAGKARRTGEPVKLEPMPAGERRIIHLALQDDPSVSTESEGEAPYRYVVISPNR
ncbi:RNA-binding cell elongation regulator Jag/EloR [Dialister hominis]|uniref:RNA-binding cell elongation regulator Jag/EloR n=1 Tax=Dialister hominis TaxID=2582419 RepID=UPI004028B373